MKKRIYQILVALALAVTTSCDTDFLNQEPLDKYSAIAVWQDPVLVEAFVNNIYIGIPFPFHTIMLANLVDEAHFNADWETGNVTKSQITPSYLAVFGNGFWVSHERHMTWGNTYSYIRACNLFMERIEEVPFDDMDAKNKLKGEVLFLRAYFYHQLVSLYGGVPLITESYTLTDDFTAPRNTYEECIKFITEECNKAAALLPPAGDRARATQGAALALKSRVLLYAASDLYNSNVSWAEDYSNKELVSYTGGDRQSRWKAAKDAAQAIIDLGIYDLYGGVNPATPEEATENYANIFLNYGSSEDIFLQFNDNLRNGNWDAPNPGLFTGPNGWHNWGESAPIGQFVDKFEMIDGTAFNWDNPEHKENPYLNRDPRFYASVLYEGAQWRPRPADVIAADPFGIVQVGSYTTADGTIVPGLDTRKGPIEDWNGSYTGYYLRKFIDPTVDHQYEKQDLPFRRFRYTEILLNYAEACLGLGEEAEAKKYINMVRARAGMPDVTASGLELIQAYRTERSVELGFEEHRFFDVRRWMMGEEAYEDATGVNVTGKLNADGRVSDRTYSVITAQEREWNSRFYFLPIEIDEMNRNDLLVQNPLY